MKISCLAIFFVIFVSLFVATIKADDDTKEYYVDSTNGDDANDGDSGSPFASLNGALNAFKEASATSDTPLYNLIINVKKGTYTGNDNLGIPFFVNTTVQNTDDEDNTVIFTCDENNANAFNPLYGSFQLFYVTIANCQRGVNVEYGTTLNYQDVYVDHVIFQNISNNAIWIEFSSSTAIKDSFFESPAGDAYNAFINVIGNFSAGLDIINNVFQDGSGIQIFNMNGGNIFQNSFTNMYGNAPDSPPALYILGGVWDIEDNKFINVSSDSLGIVSLYASTPDQSLPAFGNYTLKSNDFEGCISGYYGGAVYFNGVLGFIDDCTFTGNQALLGGAVFLSGANVTIQKSTFGNNYANRTGGAIDIELTSTLFLYDNEFSGNQAGANFTSNTVACCATGSALCTSQLIVNNGDQGDFVDSNACQAIQYVSTKEYFQTLASYQFQTFTSPSGSSLWWLWLLVSFALIAAIVVVGVAVGFFIYTKKKRSYEQYA